MESAPATGARARAPAFPVLLCGRYLRCAVCRRAITNPILCHKSRRRLRAWSCKAFRRVISRRDDANTLCFVQHAAEVCQACSTSPSGGRREGCNRSLCPNGIHPCVREIHAQEGMRPGQGSVLLLVRNESEATGSGRIPIG